MLRAPLTRRQAEIYEFVKEELRNTGFFPTVIEIANHFGFNSTNSARQHLRLIEKKGWIARVPHRSRAVVLMDPNTQKDPLVNVPLLGRIPAGELSLATQETEAILTFPAFLFGGSHLFALRVRGNSMNGAGIFDGDIAVLDGERERRNGAITAVLVEDETTLKRVYLTSKGVLLRAENPDFRDVEISRTEAKRVQLLGTLVGVIRKIEGSKVSYR